MQSSFDTRAARFDPDQTAVLSVAYQLAVKSMACKSKSCDRRLPSNTKSKLAKVVVNLGRERLRQHLELDAEEISQKAAECVSQLRESMPH